MFITCQNLEEELDKAIKKIDEMREENCGLIDEKEML